MNGLSFTNNEGYSFKLFINGDAGSIQVKDKFEIDLGIAPIVYLNDLTPDEMEAIHSSEVYDRKRLITQFLSDRFKKLRGDANTSRSNKTFKVQCYDYKGKPAVIFGQYGLLGGLRKKAAAVLAAGGQVAGAVLIVSTTSAALPAIAAGGLLVAGIRSIFYAIRTPEDRINARDLAVQSVTGFAGGAAGGGAGIALNAVAAPIIAAIGSGVTSTTVGTLAEATITQDPTVLNQLTPANLAASAVVGVVTAGVGHATGGAVNGLAQNLFPSSSGGADVLMRTATGAAAGAASNSVMKISDNAIKRINYLSVMYKIPTIEQIEQGKLYLFLENDEICFQSVNEYGQMLLTRIKEQSDFLVEHDLETQLESLKAVLKSQGQSNFSIKQMQFIIDSAAKYQHLPVSLLNGVADAAAVGATAGAVIGFTSSFSAQSKEPSAGQKSAMPVKRNDEQELPDAKRRIVEGSSEQLPPDNSKHSRSHHRNIDSKNAEPKEANEGNKDYLSAGRKRPVEVDKGSEAKRMTGDKPSTGNSPSPMPPDQPAILAFEGSTLTSRGGGKHRHHHAKPKPGDQQIGAQPAKSKPGDQRIGAQPAKSEPGDQQYGAQPVKSKPGDQQIGAQPAKPKPGDQQIGVMPQRFKPKSPQPPQEATPVAQTPPVRSTTDQDLMGD